MAGLGNGHKHKTTNLIDEYDDLDAAQTAIQENARLNIHSAVAATALNTPDA